MSPKCEVPSRPLVGESAFAMYCIMVSQAPKAAHQQRALVADHGREPVILIERISGRARAGLLAQSEINSADYLALLVEIFERDLHFAVEQHVAIDLDALLLVEILGVANRWDRRVEIARTS